MLAQHGVVSVGIDASLSSYRFYQTRIYQNSSCSSWFLDHTVACVGYRSENGTGYWIVRNSWGTEWGEQGYVGILRGRNCAELRLLQLLLTFKQVLFILRLNIFNHDINFKWIFQRNTKIIIR